MRIIMMSLTALAAVVTTNAAPLQARERGDDRTYFDQRELHRDRNRVDAERRDLNRAYRSGSIRAISREKHEFKRAKKEFRHDSKDWNRGRSYSYNRPDPRYNGYYADNYYRGGANYQPRRLSSDDRIYRGQDNRYYCRRDDGTTGLIIGALGGGVLGNVIAPGGSKTLGSVIGGGLGAVLGSAISKGNVTCR